MENEFLGKFEGSAYTCEKSFIEGHGVHLRLYFTRFTPKQRPVATICIIHGFGEHSGRFKHIAESFLVNMKYEVLLIDMRGFGYSGGPRGCSQVEDLQKDVLAVIKQANPDIPLFLYGHSLGGLVLTTLAYQYPRLNISGIMLTSPLLGFPLDRRLPWLKAQIVKLAGHKLEDFVINSMVNPTALTKSNKHIETIFGDRLMIPFLSVKMARSILINVEKIQAKAPEMRVPILIVHGKEDSVTNYHDSVDFIQKVNSKGKHLHIFQHGYHELQHDEECTEMLQIAHKWFGQLKDTTPLGSLNLQRRKHSRGTKIPWHWIILIILYILAVIKLAKKTPNKTFIQTLLSPIMYLMNRSS